MVSLGVLETRDVVNRDAAACRRQRKRPRVGSAAKYLVACLALAAIAPAAGAELQDQTLRAYEDYVNGLSERFNDRIRTGGALWAVDEAPWLRKVVAEGHVLVQPAGDDGIIGIPGGLIHHWRGAVFIPDVEVTDAVAIAQAYAQYDDIYESIIDAGLLERRGDVFRVRMRIQKNAGPVSAVLDVWSVVRYVEAHGRLYSTADSERIAEVRDAGEPGERRLAPDGSKGYLWRASTFSRFEPRDGGVLVEYENVGLSRAFPSLLGWVIEPIARRLGRSSIEDSLTEFRQAVVAARRNGEAP